MTTKQKKPTKAEVRRLPVASFCVECGPNVLFDEDGCCAYCGATATGPWADKAVAALAKAKTKK